MLHIIKSIDAIEASIQFSHPDDQFILVEDAVYGLISQKVLIGVLKDHLDHCYALESDIQARGLSFQLVLTGKVIDFNGFVFLSENHQQIITWE
ncbi:MULTISPECIES: sulfurtransferase complex subunit TusB [Vibrio]|uniref:Sulfurtransferase complex subunit TusB n=1 Tax=Vibrio casei TaxID=673372 RepID=A0A368LKN2_9VIBR|nr:MULTISPECIES: sulfurtransferase complex subunit TusB [Vibrio]RCS72391.1 sulfurtransferase complex subunit TusB [Vibrio casei]SJN29312.1 hypothetical protein FM109_08875 [Vibrio casei]HBV76080.1 sulfurtransferase complex subunit TusB [Vibrio sp.]